MIRNQVGARVRRRLVAGAALAVASVVVVAAPTSGQDPPLPDEVSIDDAFAVGGLVDRDCDGDETGSPGFASVLLSREAPVGQTLDTEVTVDVTYSGPVADVLVTPPPEVTFPIGEASASLDVDFSEAQGGLLTVAVAVAAGPGTVVTDPTSIDITVDDPEVVNDCATPITSRGETRQTITVGEVPERLFPLVPRVDDDGDTVYDLTFSYVDGEELSPFYFFVEDGQPVGDTTLFDDLLSEAIETPVTGVLPAGLGYDSDQWSGAATTPGTYPFQVSLCLNEDAVPDEEPGTDLVDDAPRSDRAPFSDDRAGRIREHSQGRLDPAGLECVGTLDVEITVVPAPVPPPVVVPPTPVAPAAVPVTEQARFTG